MALVVSIGLQAVYTKLRELVLAVVPTGVQCIQGQGNRAAMPLADPGFVVMTVTLNKPMRTPIDSWAPADPAPTAIEIEQGMWCRMQLDCYGALSADWAVALTALLRDEYGCTLLGPDVAPLYADDPLQAALINGEEQYEERWIVGANLQYNPVISTPAQFADTLTLDLISVDERYPP